MPGQLRAAELVLARCQQLYPRGSKPRASVCSAGKAEKSHVHTHTRTRAEARATVVAHSKSCRTQAAVPGSRSATSAAGRAREQRVESVGDGRALAQKSLGRAGEENTDREGNVGRLLLSGSSLVILMTNRPLVPVCIPSVIDKSTSSAVLEPSLRLPSRLSPTVPLGSCFPKGNGQ